jgi:hypothetical protein
MHTFEDIRPGARLRGLDPAGIAEVVQISHFGPDALNLVFRVDGRVGERLVYRGEESGFEFLQAGRSYAFDADGGLLRLASEAYRIRLAYLFDPYLAVSASQIEALPHQITAVYGEMLPRQPLRWRRAREIGYCGIASGVVDRGFATLLPLRSIGTPPLDFSDPPALSGTPRHQCGPPPRFLGSPSTDDYPTRTRSWMATSRTQPPPLDFSDPPCAFRRPPGRGPRSLLRGARRAAVSLHLGTKSHYSLSRILGYAV